MLNMPVLFVLFGDVFNNVHAVSARLVVVASF